MLVRRQTSQLPDAGLKIYLRNNFYTLVDEEDAHWFVKYHWFVKWSHKRPYVVRRIRSPKGECLVRLHRMLMQTRPEFDCHHKNHNTLDNRRENLENIPTAAHQVGHRQGML